MSSIPEEKKRDPVPELGEHTKEILSRYLGYTADKIAQLKENGVI